MVSSSGCLSVFLVHCSKNLIGLVRSGKPLGLFSVTWPYAWFWHLIPKIIFDGFGEVSACMVLVGCRFCNRYDQQGLLPPIVIGNRYVYIPNSMFHVSFWCVAFPVSIPEIKWSCYPDVFLRYVCEGAWFILNFHVMLTILFIVTRVLFRVLCLGIFVSVFGLRIKLMETVLQLVILVAAVIVCPECI